MSNISKRLIEENQSLSYSSSQSNKNPNYEKLSDSLQYLDRIKAINQKVLNSRHPLTVSHPSSSIQKLTNILSKDITLIDNERLYGIVRVETFETLKQKLKQLQEQSQTNKQSESNLLGSIQMVKQQLQRSLQRESLLKQDLSQAQQRLKQEEEKNKEAQVQITYLNEALQNITKQRVHDSRRYLALQNDFQNYKYNQQPSPKQSTYQMASETQTQHTTTIITIPNFQPNLQQILKELQSKSNQKPSRSSLKLIVQQSLQAFVQQLDSQYQLIQKQTIHLNQLQSLNFQLTRENAALKSQIETLSIEQSKLGIFKTCMTEFLHDTTKNVTKSLEEARTKNKISQQIQRLQSQSLMKNAPDTFLQGQQSDQVSKWRGKIENLERQNLRLIKTIGEYQYKWRNVEKVLEQSKKQEIPDDGTVGQLVKMSRLVKQSIKNLLHQL